MAAKKKTSKKRNTFETNLSELEQLVDRLEQGDLPLEQALKEFEQGIQLARECQSALKKAEQTVEILLKKHADAAPEPYSLEHGAEENNEDD